MQRVKNLLTHPQNIRFSGLIGSLVITLGVLISALTYTGKSGEPYSFFNHFISELGEVGVAENAWAFNYGLIIGGAFFMLFVLGVGLLLANFWSIAGLFSGALAAVCMSLVGYFPMVTLAPHIFAAMNYFQMTLLTLILFTVGVLRQPSTQIRISKKVTIFSVFAISCYSGFLIWMQVKSGEIHSMMDPGSISSRPAIWFTPILEWSIFFSTLLLFFAIAVSIVNNNQKKL